MVRHQTRLHPKMKTIKLQMIYISLVLSCFDILGLCFALDPSTVPTSLRLSNSCCTVTYCGETLPALHLQNQPRVTSDCVSLPHVCADVVISRGQYYWEVDVCNSSVYRVGKKYHALTGFMPLNSFAPETFTISE